MTSSQRVELIHAEAFDPGHFALAHAQLIGVLPARSTIHHIGSTSIPNILCKPLLDVLIGVPSPDGLDALDQAAEHIAALDYEVCGEFGIPGRRYYRRVDAAGVHHVHVHAFLLNDPHHTRHLAFRDFMRAHPRRAARYSALKQQLVTDHDHDREAYIEGKHDFITATDALASAWIGEASPDITCLAAACHKLLRLHDEEDVLDEAALHAHIHDALETHLWTCRYHAGELLYCELVDEVLEDFCTFVQQLTRRPPPKRSFDPIRQQVIVGLFPIQRAHTG